MKKIFALILIAAMLLNISPVLGNFGGLTAAAAVTFDGGSGTSDDPYLVSTPEQLDAVRNNPGACFLQTNDISLSQYPSWTPIGGFNGTYDGGGYEITNLTINGTASGGLFGENSGTIKNLSVNCDIDINSPATTAFTHVGAIAYRNSGVIENCRSSGSISAEGRIGTFVGGIAGINTGEIIGCGNTAEVSGDYAGGIAGTGSGTISDSYNSGYISGEEAGGIVGETGTYTSSVQISGCYNSGAVYASSAAGGIAGSAGDYSDPAEISGCYNTGSVEASGSYIYAGGIAGNGYYARITNSYNIGEVTYRGTASGEITGTVRDEAQIVNCYYEAGDGKVGAGYGTGGTQKVVAEAKTAEELTDPSMASTLNGSGADRLWSYDLLGINGGYPVLSWQNSATEIVPSHAPGSYMEPFLLSLSGTGICDIYYTLDGSDPVVSETRIQYTEPFMIYEGRTTVRAYAQYSVGEGNVTELVYTVATYPVTASHPSGEYNNSIELALSTSEADAEIYYTLNGSNPTVMGTRYTSPLELYGNTTVKAAARKDGVFGDVSTYEYTFASLIKASHESGSYTEPIEMELTGSIPQHSIYYTLDGSDPTVYGSLYTDPVTVFRSATLRAAAEWGGSWGEEYVFEYTYPEPQITPSVEPGTYEDVFLLTLSDNLSYGEIYTDISGEYQEYTGTLTIYKTISLGVQLRYGDNILTSETLVYTLPAAEITASPAAGTYDDVQTVRLSCNVPSYQLFYTTDGSDPAVYGLPYEDGIDVEETTTIRAAAMFGDEVMAEESFAYNIEFPYVTASMSEGLYSSPINVILTASDPNEYIVLYTTDGSDPRVNGTEYTSPILINRTRTIRAVPKSRYGERFGEEAQFTYRFNQSLTAEILSVLRDGDSYNITAEVANSYPDPEEVSFFAAVYDDDRLEDVKLFKYTAAENSSETISFSYIPDIQLSEDFDIKIMAWKSASIEPCGSAYLSKVSEIAAVPKLESITPSVSDINVYYGSAAQSVTVTAAYTEGKPDTVITSYTSTSTDENVARLQNGYIQFGEPGSAVITISYTEDGITETAQISVTVNENELTGITPSASNISAYYGGASRYITVTAQYDHGVARTVSNYTSTSTDATVARLQNGYILFGEPGSAVITLSYTENGITETAQIYVSVSIKMYDENPSIPDYGALNGVSPIISEPQQSEDGYGYIYAYTTPDEFDDIENYFNLLEKAGYIFSDSLSDGEAGYISYLNPSMTTMIRLQIGTNGVVYVMIVYS